MIAEEQLWEKREDTQWDTYRHLGVFKYNFLTIKSYIVAL